MKKKGFTLIELLGVIIILGILLVIAVPTVTRYLKRGTLEYYHSLENEMKTTGMDYLETYRTLLPRQIGDVEVVPLEELVSNKYIDEVKDEDGKICSGRVAVKKIKAGEYEYYSCLICDSYKTEGESCDFNESNNNYGEQGKYKVEVDIESSKEICQGTEFTLPYAKAYYTGNGVDELVSDKVVGRPDSIDTKKLGKTNVKYSYHGTSKEIEVVVKDCKNPTNPEVVLKYDNSNGKVYKGEWYSGNIYQKFKSTDYTGKGLLGSGIKEYQVSTDNKTFTGISGDSLIEENSGIHTKYVKSIDKEGNPSEIVKYTFKIDKEVPTCGLKVTSGTAGNNGYYKSNVTVDWNYKNEKVSSIVQSSISTKSVTSEGTTRVEGLVTDEAGNIGTCSIDIKIEKNVSIPNVIYNGGSNSCSWKNNYNLTFSSSAASGINIYEIDWNDDEIVDSRTSGNFVPINEFSSCVTKIRAVSVAGNISNWTPVHHIHMDTEKPVHTNWWWDEVNTKVARLYIQASDNIGINKVQCSVSTANGSFNNWKLFDAIWDSNKKSYRCDITPSSFGHYNQKYKVKLYIYDYANNGGYYGMSSVLVPILLKDAILNYSLVTATPTLTAPFNQTNDRTGLYKSTDTNSGNPTYYFRGNSQNNYVEFAGFVWRIVRINEDGTIRLIMQNSISDSKTYNWTDNYTDYLKSYYSNSNVKTSLNTWYNNNIGNNTQFANRVATGNYFCQQAKVSLLANNCSYCDYSLGNFFLPSFQIYKPNFKCSNDTNGYGIVNSNVGLINYDEVVFAGGYDTVYASSPGINNYYLKNSDYFWMISPAGKDVSGNYSVWRVSPTVGSIDFSSIKYGGTLRPVINLKADTMVTGAGNSYSSYVVYY